MSSILVSPSPATDNGGGGGRNEMVAPKLKGWVVVSYPMPNDDAERPLFSSVQESGDECTGWGLGVDGHVPANRDLKRSESTGSESSVASELLSELETQDTNSQSTGIEKIIKRKYLLNYLTQKHTTCMRFQTSVPIPSCISKRCTKASLEILIFPYVKESSPWPERYSYIQLCLTIPKAYLIPLTVTYSCKLVFSLSVTAHKPRGEEDELPEGETPIEITMDVGERVCDSAKIKLICHTHLLDTLCEGVKFLGNAYFKLTPKHVTIPEYKMADDFVDIDAPPIEIDATPPLTDEEITPPLVDEEAAPPPTDKETTHPLVDAPPPTDKETTLHEEAIPPPMDEEDAPPVV